jgi:hypothetical protein
MLGVKVIDKHGPVIKAPFMTNTVLEQAPRVMDKTRELVKAHLVG